MLDTTKATTRLLAGLASDVLELRRDTEGAARIRSAQTSGDPDLLDTVLIETLPPPARTAAKLDRGLHGAADRRRAAIRMGRALRAARAKAFVIHSGAAAGFVALALHFF